VGGLACLGDQGHQALASRRWPRAPTSWRGGWAPSAGGALASAAYTYAPFHQANVYVRGDALFRFTRAGSLPGSSRQYEARRTPLPRRGRAGRRLRLRSSANIPRSGSAPLHSPGARGGAVRSREARVRALAWGLGGLRWGLWLAPGSGCPRCASNPSCSWRPDDRLLSHPATFAPSPTRPSIAATRLSIDATRDPSPWVAPGGGSGSGRGAAPGGGARAPIDALEALSVAARGGLTGSSHLPRGGVGQRAALALHPLPWRMLSIQALPLPCWLPAFPGATATVRLGRPPSACFWRSCWPPPDGRLGGGSLPFGGGGHREP
jgi:hypothetical protein